MYLVQDKSWNNIIQRIHTHCLVTTHFTVTYPTNRLSRYDIPQQPQDLIKIGAVHRVLPKGGNILPQILGTHHYVNCGKRILFLESDCYKVSRQRAKRNCAADRKSVV